MSAVVYARASTKEQVASCDGQIRECTARAKVLGLKITATFVDDGISGARHDRPAYKKMLAAANGKQFETLFLFSQSRLGRDSMETERAMRQLEFHGVRVITCDGYDTANMPVKMRKMTRGMKGLMDEAFLEDLREATHRGLHDAFLEGHWAGGRPYGYRLVKIVDATRRDSYDEPVRIGARLEIDIKQAAIVREIFERYAQGASPQSIAADLNERGIPSPGSVWKREIRRCKGWARSGIWAMLKNPLYAGTYYWNRSQWTKTEVGRVRKIRGKEDIKGTVGNAPELAIIKPATMRLVQLRLGINANKPKDKRLQMGGRAVYMLSGMLLCECGAHYVMDNATHYSCAAYRDGRACQNNLRVRRDLAERVILKPIINQLLAPAMVEDMADEMRRYFMQQVAAAKAAVNKRPAAVSELDARISRLQDRLKKGDADMAPDEIAAIIETAKAKRDALLADAPAAQRNAKILQALPAAAAQYRQQIEKGLQGNAVQAGRARVAVRQLLGKEITLKPASDKTHLVAHLQFHGAALLGGQFATVGFVGSGGRI